MLVLAPFVVIVAVLFQLSCALPISGVANDIPNRAAAMHAGQVIDTYAVPQGKYPRPLRIASVLTLVQQSDRET